MQILVLVGLLLVLLAIQVFWKPSGVAQERLEVSISGSFDFYDEIEKVTPLETPVDIEKTLGMYLYRVRVGVYQEEGANREVERLKDIHPFVVEPKALGSRVYYAVYSQWFDSRRQANFFRDQMINLGLDTFLERKKRAIIEPETSSGSQTP